MPAAVVGHDDRRVRAWLRGSDEQPVAVVEEGQVLDPDEEVAAKLAPIRDALEGVD